jgi:MFS family permease
MNRAVFLVTAACLAEIFSMAGFATFPSLLPTFQQEWGLSNTEAGWINAVYFGGYLLAVLILVSLTDRMDARRIYLLSMAVTVFATGGFSFFAQGFWSALLLRTLSGIGLAGTYMPGLKMLSDVVEGPGQSRAVAFYTSSFGVGASLSYYLSGVVTEWRDWHRTFELAAIGPALAMVIVFLVLPASPQPAGGANGRLRVSDFLRVLRNRGAMGYVLAYAVHNWELFALRSWIVAYIVFIQRLRPGIRMPFAPTTLAAFANLMSVPASVLGNELSTRFGRRRIVSLVMFASALLAYAMGTLPGLSGIAVTLIVIGYGLTVAGESASVTAGVVAEAEAGLRGVTMAVYSSIGFAGSFLGPLVFGVLLDKSGGGDTVGSWGLAFTVMGLVVATGPLMMLPLTRGAKTDESG